MVTEAVAIAAISHWQYVRIKMPLNRDRLVYLQRGQATLPNSDLPDDIRRDYDEASSNLDLSPRGAAALLRLAIQKLCKYVGEPGENLNTDIGSLVQKGLDPKVQQALDFVRVIGNNAVHPGEIDLRDDRATAESLFRLLNLMPKKCSPSRSTLMSSLRHCRPMLVPPLTGGTTRGPGLDRRRLGIEQAKAGVSAVAGMTIEAERRRSTRDATAAPAPRLPSAKQALAAQAACLATVRLR